MFIPSFCKPLPIVPKRDSTRPLTGHMNPPSLGAGSFTPGRVVGARFTVFGSGGNTCLPSTRGGGFRTADLAVDVCVDTVRVAPAA